MDADIYIEFVRKNSSSFRSSVCKLMGGEPTLHPRIIDIILESAKHYQVVQLFTNGSRLNKIANHPEIVKEVFKGKVCYVINGYAFDQEKFEEYKQFVNALTLHFVITPWGYKETLQKMYDCMKYQGEVNLEYVISTDTQVDLFDEEAMNSYRKIWLDFIKEIVPVIQSRGINWKFMVCVPIYTPADEMLNELNSVGLNQLHFGLSCCQCPDIGLIDWNWDFWYCNQTRIKLGTVLKENGEPKTLIELINEYITSAHGVKTKCIENLREDCKNCGALSTCRVGCYYNTLVKHCS